MNPNELKSAEEWAMQLRDTRDRKGQILLSAVEWNQDIVKQIQLNAIKSGMTKAAEITKQGDGYEHKAGYWSEKILDARDKIVRL